MNRRCLMSGMAVMVLSFAPPVWSAEPVPVGGLLTPEQLAARIDHWVAARWAEKGIQPAPLADDAEFYRRLSLDLNGRIPSVLDLSYFLDDRRPDKRRLWVAELIAGDDHRDLFVRHWAAWWHEFLFSRTTNQRARFIGRQLEPWLREQVKANAPYNRMVRELLAGDEGRSFYRANEDKPENLAGNTARLFLGVNLECAQCHDHPTARWTRQQFWETAAFFAPGARDGDTAKIKLPNTGQVARARFLDGGEPSWAPQGNPRAVLAEWLASPQNPYFARALVNRLWEYFLGTGLTEPVEATGPDNPPSHPELLDELAGQFMAHCFDVEYLIRAIANCRIYQLTSRKTGPGPDDPRLFARMAVRGLSPDQVYDSLIEALGVPDRAVAAPSLFGGQPATPRGELLVQFGDIAERRAGRQTSILQALYLMNGAFLEEALAGSKNLATVQANVAGTVDQNLADLYLAALSRRPTPDELRRLHKYVASGGPAHDRKAALADVFWALLNCGEFLMNH
jgi:uncharacterized protein DUF1549/uncharacterized protein DUF1553